MEVDTEMQSEMGMAMEIDAEGVPNDLKSFTVDDGPALEAKDMEDVTPGISSKKTTTMNGDMRRVAEIVMVLSAMAAIRAGRGREPTEAEVKLMSDARSRLADVCKELSPKDIVGNEAVGALIEDLGLNWKGKDQRLGLRGTSRLSIKERIALAAKKKAEEAKKLSAPSANYPSHITQSNMGQISVSHGSSNNVRVSDKLQSSSVSASSHLPSALSGRESSVTSFSRTDRTQMKLEPSGTPLSLRSSQLQSIGHMIHSNVPIQGAKYGHNSTLMSNHTEIAKIVQKVLLPKLPECPSWTPPSRDYMSKTVTCQLCKHPVTEVETIVICDSCEKGFHLKCLEASNQKGIPRAEWHCAKCLSLSNGKPLPPKYGRVMRSLTPQKGSVNPPATPQKLIQEKTANNSSAPSNSARPISTNSTTEPQANHEKSVLEASDSSNPLNDSENVSVLSGSNQDVNLLTITDSNYFQTPENLYSSQIHPPIDNITSDQGNSLANFPISFPEASKDSSVVDLQNVEWVGNALRILDGKTYYQSCSIGGVTYEIYDYALISSRPNRLTPSRLQAMWEDNKNSTKWISVKQCYSPSDLPESINCPDMPEINEVYESNHEGNVMAALIKGPCEVMSSTKLRENEEKEQPVFICRWLYDEVNRSFQPVSS